MEPLVPDGSWCIFAPPPWGSRQGKNLIVWHSTINDPEGLGQYTLKRWSSKKYLPSDESHEAWEHTQILLEPINTAYDEIRIKLEDADSVKVIAELIRVL